MMWVDQMEQAAAARCQQVPVGVRDQLCAALRELLEANGLPDTRDVAKGIALGAAMVTNMPDWAVWLHVALYRHADETNL